jgi:hypothetical protein
MSGGVGAGLQQIESYEKQNRIHRTRCDQLYRYLVCNQGGEKSRELQELRGGVCAKVNLERE